MRHGFRKVKFGLGIDANRMLLRKMAFNFLKNGKMVTTEKKAKALQSYVETLVQKSKVETEASRNFLLKKLGSVEVIKTLYGQIGPALKDKPSGFITLRRLHARVSDGATMAEVRWSVPVMVEEEKEPEKSLTHEKQSAQPVETKK